MESGVQFAMKHGTAQKLMSFVGNLDSFLLVSGYFIKIEFRNYRLKYHVLYVCSFNSSENCVIQD